MSAGHVRLMLVDDHPCIRLGLSALFRTVPHFDIVGEAGTAAQAIELARTARPDVVIMDVRLPDGMAPRRVAKSARSAPTRA